VKRSVVLSGALAVLALALASSAASPSAADERPVGHRTEKKGRRAPETLAETGLYSDPAAKTVAPGVLSFSPQYPLWSDGAAKHRWIRIPDGASIDASDPDAWKFPVGTKLWKEFAFERRVETRFLRLEEDGTWTYATYRWSDDEREARLVPERGAKGVAEIRPGIRHDLPGVSDCRACHTGRPVEVLGFTALQLSPDRDPMAPHAEKLGAGDVDLKKLVELGVLKNLPPSLLERAPRIEASSPRERAALGYLQSNCGICHNGVGPLSSLGMKLDAPVSAPLDALAPAFESAVGVPSRYQPNPSSRCVRIDPGAPATSALAIRMGSRNPYVQMPPLGTHLVDEQALALVEAWIREDLAEKDPSDALDLDPRKHTRSRKEKLK
jgi:hypothetical protein